MGSQTGKLSSLELEAAGCALEGLLQALSFGLGVLGFRGLGFRVYGLGFEVKGFRGLRLRGLGFKARVLGVWCGRFGLVVSTCDFSNSTCCLGFGKFSLKTFSLYP